MKKIPIKESLKRKKKNRQIIVKKERKTKIIENKVKKKIQKIYKLKGHERWRRKSSSLQERKNINKEKM